MRRRDPDLPHGRVGTDDELRFDRLLEENLQHAVLKLDLEPFLVGEREERVLRALQRLVGLHAELLLGQVHRQIICHTDLFDLPV